MLRRWCAHTSIDAFASWHRHLTGWSSAGADISIARTPPADWYFSRAAHEADAELLQSGWRLASVQPLAPCSFQAGSTPGVEYLLIKDGNERVQAFHNVRPALARPA